MFLTTHWSLIVDVRGSADQARAALDSLCAAYRRPVIAFLRQQGFSREDADDAAQGFFVELLERRTIERADRARGRFRTFLLAALRNHLSNLRDHDGAHKRGGRVVHAAIDGLSDGELPEMRPGESPEAVFDRAWAMTVLDRALARLRSEAEESGKTRLFETLCPFVIEPVERQEYQELAHTLDMKPNTIAVVVGRLRARYRELIEAELIETIGDRRDLESELELLRRALRP